MSKGYGLSAYKQLTRAFSCSAMRTSLGGPMMDQEISLGPQGDAFDHEWKVRSR